MTNAVAPPAGRPWFTDQDEAALQDFWRVCEAHADEVERMGSWPDLPSPALILEWFRPAMAGRWSDYEAEVRTRGASYAERGLAFRDLIEIIGDFHRRLVPHILQAYPEPGRASSALQVASRFFDHAIWTLVGVYESTKESLLAHQRELALGHSERAAASEMRYRVLFESNPLPMWVFELRTLQFLDVNEAAIRHYGYSREEFLRMTLKDIRPREDVASLLEDVGAVQRWSEGTVWRHRKRDGSTIQVEIKAHQLDLAGLPARLVVANDVTDRLRAQDDLRRTEDQLRQSQKMDAIGRLAGGIAHDFNNLLSVILTFSELQLKARPDADPGREDLQEIHRAGERAAALTRQLLAFTRQQMLDLKPMDLNAVVNDLDKMLRRVIGEHIELVTRPAPDLGHARGDVGRLEQVVLNLVINARDAMPNGGRVTLETAMVHLDEAYCREHLGSRPGPHVMLAVSDTGVGMSKETQAHLFEPFFTTKEKGKGTGLGLSVVFGIVQQLGGSIWVYSEEGKGSTFKLYFPRTDEVGRPAEAGPTQAPRGDETILLVEDEATVRDVASRILSGAGYRVLAAAGPSDAVRLCREHPGTIDLLVSDVVMPEMSGPKLAEQLIVVRPAMRVLFISGYTDDAVIGHGVLSSGSGFVQKPLTPDALTLKVREVLTRPRS